MQRTQIYLTEEQRVMIARRATDTGVSQAQVIREILDDALGLGGDARERVTGVHATAGILADAPDWPDWLRRVRGRTADRRLKEMGL